MASYCENCGPAGCLCDWAEEQEVQRLIRAAAQALAAGVTLEEIKRVVDGVA